MSVLEKVPIRKFRWLPPAATLALYLPTLGFQFVWDDIYFVQFNPWIRSLGNAGLFFTDPQTTAAFSDIREIYRPLRTLTYALEYAVWGGAPMGYHLTNVLLHVLVVVLVGKLAKKLLTCGSRAVTNSTTELAGFAAGMVMAVHPLALEAVCWVKGREDLMVGGVCAGVGDLCRPAGRGSALR